MTKPNTLGRARLGARGASARLFCALLACLLLLGACRNRPEGEEAIRQTIAQATEAAEKRELRTLSGMLSTAYDGGEGRDREAVLGVLRYYFLGHQSLYLLTRIRTIELLGDQRAQATVLVAMAGEPLTDPNEPSFVRASLYRFEFDFVLEDDAWKVIQARWQRANARDFLPGNS